MMFDIPDDWLPTPENVNKLPKPVFDYVHGLESLCDPAHIIMENTLLRDQTKLLDAYIAKLKAKLPPEPFMNLPCSSIFDKGTN